MLLIYSIIIAWLYYRKEIRHLLFARRDSLQEMIDRPVIPIDHMPLVHELVHLVGDTIRKASENKTLQPELLYSIKLIIKEYPFVSGTEYKEKINQYIQEEITRYGLDKIDEEALEGLWKP